MNRVFVYLNGFPWTKPIAILTWTVNLLVFVAAWLFTKDIPPNAKELGIYFGGVVFAAAAGKSGYEAVRRPARPKRRADDENEGGL